MMIAVFRRLQGGPTGYFITLPSKYVPPRFTLTIASVEKKLREYEHLEKRRGRSMIKSSVKITINKEVVRALGLKPHDVVWVRLLPYTDNPPPPEPCIAMYRTVHTDKTSMFFLVAVSYIDILRSILGIEGRNLRITVVLQHDGVVKELRYIKKPTLIPRDRIYKVVLPSALFEGLVKKGDVIWVKIVPTDEEEEYFYV